MWSPSKATARSTAGRWAAISTAAVEISKPTRDPPKPRRPNSSSTAPSPACGGTREAAPRPAEAAAPHLPEHAPAAAPAPRAARRIVAADRRGEPHDVVGLGDRRQRPPATVALGVDGRRVGALVEAA